VGERFITITGVKHYFGTKPFIIGNIIKLTKEPDNKYDSESIRVELPYIGKIGYVANSTRTVANGTMSAGRLYDFFESTCSAEVMFVVGEIIIAKVLNEGITITVEQFKVKMDEDKGFCDIFEDIKKGVKSK